MNIFRCCIGLAATVLALSVAAVEGVYRLRRGGGAGIEVGVNAPVPSAPPQPGAKAAAASAATAGKPKKRVSEPGALLPPAQKPSPDKEQLIKWLRANSPGMIEAELKKLQLYLNGQLLFTFEDLIKLGPDGVKSLPISPKIRAQFTDLLVAHIGQTRGVDDGLMVAVPPYTKPPWMLKKEDCKDDENPRFVGVAPPPGATVGDWLRRMFPDTPKLKMERAIRDINRQSIVTFTDLNRVGLSGVAKMLYVPGDMREKLREAIFWHLGVAGGHDDELMVPYVELKKPDNLVPAIEVKPKKTKCQMERERKGEA